MYSLRIILYFCFQMLQSSETVVASKKEFFFQAAISTSDLDKNKQKKFFELFNMLQIINVRK